MISLIILLTLISEDCWIDLDPGAAVYILSVDMLLLYLLHLTLTLTGVL